MLWAPHRSWWWLALLFGAGSLCFLVAPFPWFLRWVGPQTDGVVFFVGSLLFTSAGALQWLVAINPDRAAGRRRLVAWQPLSADWWSSGVQLAGTLFFNVTTFQALNTAVSNPEYDRLVWRPDAFGSICFLVSGYLAYVEVTGGPFRRPPHTLEALIVAVDLFGCVAFGVSALTAYVLPSTGAEVNVAIANLTTSVGALAFLVGALLLLPEAARSRGVPAAVTRPDPA